MDPISIGGLAIGVASLGLQVYTGCIQGIQLLVTAIGYQDDCKYLNLRLRMEQQHLFAWSETSGLLDLDAENHKRILNSNVFSLYRQTVLDLLVQIQCLFDNFTAHQRRHNRLRPVHDDDDLLGSPDRDACQASFPMSNRKRDFIKKAMNSLRLKSHGGYIRLRWTTFDKDAFERLLAQFAALNDSITSLLDHSLQVEIRHTVQGTHRGVLLLHRKITDLSHLLLALKSQLDTSGGGIPGLAPTSSVSKMERESATQALLQLAALAKFKAFNETVDPKAETPSRVDLAAAHFLELADPSRQRDLEVARRLIVLDLEMEELETALSEAMLLTSDGARKRVWIEWKNYDDADTHADALSKADVVDRVRKLARLLNHSPKPEAFRTPHCLGFFDKADPHVAADEVDVLDRRLGLIFDWPDNGGDGTPLPPVSLHDLLVRADIRQKPRVTDRVRLAHALSSCMLYLHAVNWLHKGLRSHNVVFLDALLSMPEDVSDERTDLAQPVLSGFDFSLPVGADEMTDAPGDDAEHDLYRHPQTQSNRRRERERSKKSFDIYGLGVVLVEMAHWRPVDAVLGIDMHRARGNPDVIRQARERLLAPSSMADVGAEMGQRYEEATRTCLTGGAALGLQPGNDETADEVAERLSVHYYEGVGKNLGGIII